MKKRTTRTIEISIKTDEHLIIKQRRNVKRLWAKLYAATGPYLGHERAMVDVYRIRCQR